MKGVAFAVSIPGFVMAKTAGKIMDSAFFGPLSGLRMQDLPEPDLPGPDWVKVEVIQSGVCGSDIGCLTYSASPAMEPFGSFPAVLGHEIVGKVKLAGEGVEELACGQRVTVDPMISCETRGYERSDFCPSCSSGLHCTCERAGEKGLTTVNGKTLAPGVTIGYHRDLPGGWGETVLAHKSQVFAVDDKVSDDTAVLIEPFSIAMHAVLGTVPHPEAPVLVLGSGTIALATIWALRATGHEGLILSQVKREHEKQMAQKTSTGKSIQPKEIGEGFQKPSQYISFSPPVIGEEEEREVLDSLRSGWITTGPKVKEFESRVARFVQAKEAVALFSCTDAMHLSLEVLGVKEGDEVITSPYTFASTGHAICYQRARPVFVDVDEETFNIDPAKIEEKINPKTKIILPVHFAGHSCDMDPIIDIARKHNLKIVEDAAHAIGTLYNGRKIGSFGDICCFSFYATKNLATSEGGMAVTNNQEWAQRMRVLSLYGISDSREIWKKRYTQAGSIHYDIAELGFKCNMTDICAALGLCQLDKLERFNKIRESYSQIYDKAFKGHLGVKTPVIKDYTQSNRHLYPLLLNLNYLSAERDEIVNSLKELNIGTSVLFMPLHLHSYYYKLLGHKWGDFPVAEKLFKRVVCLPVSPSIPKSEIEKVAEGVLFLLGKFKR